MSLDRERDILMFAVTAIDSLMEHTPDQAHGVLQNALVMAQAANNGGTFPPTLVMAGARSLLDKYTASALPPDVIIGALYLADQSLQQVAAIQQQRDAKGV